MKYRISLFVIILSIISFGFDQQRKTIIFFGDSITAGYGLSKEQAFPALVGNKLQAAKYNYKVINAGLSGETSAGGLNRIDWILKQPVDVFVLELGANDGLRGLPLDQTRKNLQGIIDKVKAKNPDAEIIIAGMMVPPNLGKTYTDEFKSIFPDLARKNKATLIPFLLEGVAGHSNLNLADGIHPNVEGHEIVAQNVYEVLMDMF
ncbi:arylesterase [Fulvivirga kasyanovii]|uniref:Arylesterase n=1 Tax=Fulvivirga kasyanovii TaxID=396812 RepID=A0ABW9RK63_9BACT|nr:arylesterase [Fulvivirga kasyanovii]MTI24346.1 arylesterase [Fulvivirga kasyanovii]